MEKPMYKTKKKKNLSKFLEEKRNYKLSSRSLLQYYKQKEEMGSKRNEEILNKESDDRKECIANKL